jgi:hypothetical protein
MIAIGWLTETAKGGLAPVLIFVCPRRHLAPLSCPRPIAADSSSPHRPRSTLSAASGSCSSSAAPTRTASTVSVGPTPLASPIHSSLADRRLTSTGRAPPESRSAEVIAINNCLRYLAAAGASAGILPLVKAIDVGPANSLFAGIGLLGFGCVLAVIRWGTLAAQSVDRHASGPSERLIVSAPTPSHFRYPGEAMSGRTVPDAAMALAASSGRAEATPTASRTSTDRPLSAMSSNKGPPVNVSRATSRRPGEPAMGVAAGAGERQRSEVEAESLRELARTVSLH